MGCKRSSVTNALQRLSANGLINYQAYRPVTLTNEGEVTIAQLSRLHRIIEDFLKNILAFPNEIARKKACKLEHQLEKDTIERLKLFMDFLRSSRSNMDIEKTKKLFEEFINKPSSKDN